MHTQATAHPVAPRTLARPPVTPITPITPTHGAPASSPRPCAPRSPRSNRLAAGLASVFVTLTLFGTVIDIFGSAASQGPLAALPSATARG